MYLFIYNYVIIIFYFINYYMCIYTIFTCIYLFFGFKLFLKYIVIYIPI